MVHQRLPDIRALNVLEVYQLLAKYTTWQATPEELKAMGWEPYLQAGLVGISTSGYLVWTGATAGGRNVTEVNSGNVVNALILLQNEMLTSAPSGVAYLSSSTQYIVGLHKRRYLSVTLAAGAAANQVINAAVSGYTLKLLLKGIISDTNIAAGLTFHFEDTDAVSALGLPGGNIVFGGITAYVPLQLNPPILVSMPAASKGANCDVTNGAGVEVLNLQYDIWGEQ